MDSRHHDTTVVAAEDGFRLVVKPTNVVKCLLAVRSGGDLVCGGYTTIAEPLEVFAVLMVSWCMLERQLSADHTQQPIVSYSRKVRNGERLTSSVTHGK